MRISIPPLIFISGFIGFSQNSLAQNKETKKAPKVIEAKRATSAIKIDGEVNEDAWKTAPVMTNLVEFRPKSDVVEAPENKTITYLLYDDQGIYFGGYCYERTKDSIATDFTGRDGFGANDYIGIIFDTYYDKQNAFEYFVTPLGEQWDAKMSTNQNDDNGGEDFSWNAVWKSAVIIQKDGWSFEMFIPYSAIRFGKKDIQNWGINITRRRKKTDQQYTWNPIDRNVNGFLTQEGIWKGITNIQPPLRLQFSPYFSTYVNHYPNEPLDKKDWTSSVNGGMDVKYGINQAFTLDATLIPDFGQVQSDNRVLNLTPFEVKYTENRPFFTEGTELFNKGNLFYARRVGIDPVLLYSASDYTASNEKVIKEPIESKLINATKISGRTQKGLGIGILNAITKTRYVTIEDTFTNRQSKEVIDPLTNYSVIVLDQTLKHNSSVSLVNTNVLRSGKSYDANVTAGIFSFNDKKNMWNVSGKFANSRLIGYLQDRKTLSGYNHNLAFGKTSGRFNFNVSEELMDDKFNSNDLGYFTNNNILNHTLWLGYKWIKPTTWYNNVYLNFNTFYSRRLTNPAIYQNAKIDANINGQLKNLCFAGLAIGYEPDNNDFYEPRKEGRFFRGWADYYIDAWFETNDARRYGRTYEVLYVKRNLFKSERYLFTIGNSYRFGNKFSVAHKLILSPQNNNAGFADIIGDDVIFGKRDIKNVENILTLKYSFSDKMNINARARHYWSEVRYDQFFTLQQNGRLQDNTTYDNDVNQNYNVFNIDMVYTWQFAPGSFITVAWKNAVEKQDKDVTSMYFRNLNNTLDYNQNNNLSVKIIYFLDYLSLKKKGQKS